MKVILAALVASVVLGLGAAALMNAGQRPAFEAFATSGARVGDPGENLVGKSWNGLNRDHKG